MPSIELVLSLDVFECLVVGVEYELRSYEIITPMLQALDDCIKSLS